VSDRFCLLSAVHVVCAQDSAPAPALDAAKRRIAEVDAWQKIHGTRLRDAAGLGTLAQDSPPPLRRVPARIPADLDPAVRADVEALHVLERDITEAWQDSRARRLSPVERVRLFEEFLTVNRGALAEQRALRSKVAAARAAARQPVGWPGPIPANAEAARKIETLRALMAGPSDGRRPTPAERIAALDREAMSLRDLARLLRPPPAATLPSAR